MKSRELGIALFVLGIIVLFAGYIYVAVSDEVFSAGSYISLLGYFLIYIGAVVFLPKKSYSRAFNYVRGSRNYIYASIALFVLSAIIGAVVYAQLGFLDDTLRELVEKTRDLSGIEITIFIFLNNVKSSLTGLFFGVVFGIFPIIASVMNGAVVGYVLRKSWDISGISDFWMLLPHGIFELPAIFISFGAGIKLGMYAFSREKNESFTDRFYNSMLVFVLVIIPLLAIAAVIEGMLIAFSA